MPSAFATGALSPCNWSFGRNQSWNSDFTTRQRWTYFNPNSPCYSGTIYPSTLRSRHWNYLTRKIRKRHRRAPTASTQTRQSPELRRRLFKCFWIAEGQPRNLAGQRDTERRQTPSRCHARFGGQYLFRIRSVSDRDPPPARPLSPGGTPNLPETGRSLIF